MSVHARGNASKCGQLHNTVLTAMARAWLFVISPRVFRIGSVLLALRDVYEEKPFMHDENTRGRRGPYKALKGLYIRALYGP